MSYGLGDSYPAPRAPTTIVAPPTRRRAAPIGGGEGGQEVPVIDVTVEPGTQPVYFSLGGGLSHSRIVKKIDMATPTELGNGMLQDLVTYALAHLETDEETMISQTVRNRMEKPDYMVVVNGRPATSQVYLAGTSIRDATMTARRGTVTFPSIDISVVSSEEAGTRAIVQPLEKIVGSYRGGF